MHCQSSKKWDWMRKGSIKMIQRSKVILLSSFQYQSSSPFIFSFTFFPQYSRRLPFCGPLEAWCYASLYFGHRSALGLTTCQRKCHSTGVCKKGSMLSQRERFQGSFNAAPVRAQLRPKILQDPAGAAVGPIWTLARDRGQDPVYPLPLASDLSLHITMKLLCGSTDLSRPVI